MNTNKLRNLLSLDYRTVRHHIEVLEDNGLVTSMGNRYGKMFFVSQQLEENMEEFEAIWSRILEKLERDMKK
jgi:DNA-binding transcriptional ArsR family regulator